MVEKTQLAKGAERAAGGRRAEASARTKAPSARGISLAHTQHEGMNKGRRQG